MQRELVQTLLTAQDSDHADFKEAQQTLQKYGDEDPVSLVTDLLQVLGDKDAPKEALFLSLVLIRHCFNKSIIPLSKDHKELESVLPSELTLQLVDVCFSFFVHPYPPVRNTAVTLFSSVASTQTSTLAERGIVQRLIGMLTASESVESVLSATECISFLMIYHKYTDEEQRQIIESLFRIISVQNGDVALAMGCIRLLGTFSYLLPRLFAERQQFLDFIGHIMSFLSVPDLKKSVYEFLDDVVRVDPSLLFVIIEKVLVATVEDLSQIRSSDGDQRGLLLGIIMLWETVATVDLISTSPELSALVVVAVRELILPFIQTMRAVPTSKVLDYIEWEPYTAAQSCVSAFAWSMPSLVVPILLEYIQNTWNSRDPLDREAALKCLKIVYISTIDQTHRADEPSLQFLYRSLTDEVPRVRAAAVDCLLMLVKKMPETCATFQPFTQPLVGLTRDEVPIARIAFNVLKLISRFDDFSMFGEFFEMVSEVIPSLSMLVLPDAIDCFAITANASISADTALSGFHFLFELLKQVMTQARVYAIINAVCIAMAKILIKVDERILSVAPQLFQAMCTCYNECNVGDALSVIAALSIPVPQFVQGSLDVFIPMVVSAQQRYEDPAVLRAGVRLVPYLMLYVRLGNYTQELLDNMIRAFWQGAGAPAKAEILHTFLTLMQRSSEIAQIAMPYVFCSVQYVVNNLEEAARHYGECIGLLVTPVCKILELMIVIGQPSDKQDLFDLSIMLVNSIVKIPPALTEVTPELVNLILCLLQHFRTETCRQIQQIPSIPAIMTAGLRAARKSEEEISQILADFMANTAESSQ